MKNNDYKNTLAFVFFFILSTNFIFSQASGSIKPFDMISTGDSALEDIRYLSLYSGTPFLSFSPPLSPAEIRNFLYSIDESHLSKSAGDAYNRLRKKLFPHANLSFSQDHFTSFLNINSTAEAKTRFNPDIREFPQISSINPIISIPIRFNFASTLQLYIEPSVTMRPNKYMLDTFDINIPANYFEYDESMPLKFFFAAGGDWWNFQIGRDRIFWGTGHTGSLTFSDNSQYFDFSRLSFISSVFKYSIIVNQLPIKLSRDLFYPDDEIINNWWEDPANRTSSVHRYYYLQRLDFTLFNKVSIGLMEGVMVGNSPLELRYLNPLRIFHSLFSWDDYDKWVPPPLYDDPKQGDMIGSILSLEINWNIIKNFSLYGQIVMNEFAEMGIKQRIPNQPPNGLGYLSGLQLAHSFGKWAAIFFLEFIYTDPYLNILSSPFGSFIQQNRYGQYYYIGYSRDTIALTFGNKFFRDGNLNFSCNFSWISSGTHNEHGLIWDWERSSEAFSERTPTGTAEQKLILAFESGWKPLSWLALNAGITGIVSLNNRHISGNNQLGGQASLSIGFHY